MAQLVPAVGVCSYNGVNFGPLTETTQLSCRPVLDSSGRTTKFNQYSITIRSHINGQSQPEVDALALLCRQALSKTGGAFVYSNRGVGTIAVNAAGGGGIRDVKNGPIPENISFQPAVGGELASIVTFTMSFCIPECPDAVFINRPMEFAYTWETSTDNYGYSTRNIRGKIIVPQNRTVPGSRFSHSNADDWREGVTPLLLPGFKRTYGPWQLSEDRSTLTFSITDVEGGKIAPPNGLVDPSGSQTISTSQIGGIQWQIAINWSAGIPKNGTMSAAINGFRDFLAFRMSWMDALKKPGKDGKQFLLLIGFSMTEPEIYGKQKVQFSATFTVTTTIDEVLKKGGGGMWQAARGNTFAQWQTSLQNSAFHPRGTARLTFSMGDDEIIDLCRGTPVKPDTAIAELRPARDEAVEAISELIPVPTPTSSWMEYKNLLRIESDDGALVTRTLPTEPIAANTDVVGEWDAVKGIYQGALNAGAASFAASGGAVLNNGGGIGNQFQLPANAAANGGGLNNDQYSQAGSAKGVRSRRPLVYIIMYGSAMRAGFPIPEPKLTDVNGIKVIPAGMPGTQGEGFICEPFYNAVNNVVLYKAVWSQRYVLDGDWIPGSKLPELPNPIYPNGAK